MNVPPLIPESALQEGPSPSRGAIPALVEGLFTRRQIRSLTDDVTRFIIKTGIFGFADGTSRLNGRYDYTRAVLWDIIEDGCVIEIAEHPAMPLCGPVHSHANLVLNPLPPSQA